MFLLSGCEVLQSVEGRQCFLTLWASCLVMQHEWCGSLAAFTNLVQKGSMCQRSHQPWWKLSYDRREPAGSYYLAGRQIGKKTLYYTVCAIVYIKMMQLRIYYVGTTGTGKQRLLRVL